MFKPTYDQIQPGNTVSILIGDHEVQGMVEEVRDHTNHPQGVEVRLMDGHVGRVQRLLQPGSATQHSTAPASYSQQTHGAAPSTQTNPFRHDNYASATTQSQDPWESSQSAYQPPQSHPQSYAPPSHPPRPTRNDLDDFPIAGQERSEQVEIMQTFESHVQPSADDVNQATLQKEFPSIDTSLIAAIYGDSKDLATTRELLQELS